VTWTHPVIGALAGVVTIGLPVVGYLMRVEHRLTRIEATIERSLPPRSA
jgi:hypothetical protein